jgi:phosphoribosyl-dephospho-CoA transferase
MEVVHNVIAKSIEELKRRKEKKKWKARRRNAPRKAGATGAHHVIQVQSRQLKQLSKPLALGTPISSTDHSIHRFFFMLEAVK